jgi:hypothetical protein
VDIIWSLLTLPYAPVRGLTAVIEVISREAQAQQHNPVNIRQELEDLDRAAEAGEIAPQERDEKQQQVLQELTAAPPQAGDSAPSPQPRRGRGRSDGT